MSNKEKKCEWCDNLTTNPRFCCRSCFFKWGNDTGTIGFKKGHRINSDGKNAMFRPDVRKKQLERSLSPEVRKRMAETKQKTLEDNFKKYGKKLPQFSQRLKIEFATGLKTPPSTKGIKISEEHKMKLWGGWKNHHTKPELMVLNSYHGLTYTGDGSKWLKFKDGTHKNPDIVFMNYNIAIEVFGDYWHKGENSNHLIDKYNEIGWDCLVLWEKDIYAYEKDGLLGYEIDRFINPDIYEPCISRHDQDYGINASLF